MAKVAQHDHMVSLEEILCMWCITTRVQVQPNFEHGSPGLVIIIAKMK
jgi:hypothetical protein